MSETPTRKWSVVKPADRTYVTSRNDCLAWTHDVGEAFDIAKGIDGQVVDTDWFREHWHEWRETGVVPDDAKPPKRGPLEESCPCPACLRCCCKYVEGLDPERCDNHEEGDCVCERKESEMSVNVAERMREFLSSMRAGRFNGVSIPGLTPECEDQWNEGYAIVKGLWYSAGDFDSEEYFHHDHFRADYERFVKSYFPGCKVVLHWSSQELEVMRL